MKLNADILYDNLKEDYAVELKGKRSEKLLLGRPEYFLEPGEGFRENHVYVLKGEQLPKRVPVSENVLLLCIGNSMYLPYYLERCGVLLFRDAVSMSGIFNRLTEIYNKYDAWDEKLHELLYTSNDIGEMINCSQDIFGNPLFVLDSDFHYIAQSDYSGIPEADWEKLVSREPEGDNLDLPVLSKFLEFQNLSMEERKPILFNMLDSSTLSVNLFEEEDYIGCLTVDYRCRKHRSSDRALAVYLARMLERALVKYAGSPRMSRHTLRQIFYDLTADVHLSSEERWLLETANHGHSYICARIQVGSRLSGMPNGYLCSTVEKAFPKSMAFEFDGGITAFFDMDSIHCDEASFYGLLKKHFISLAGTNGFDVGASDSFRDIYDARLYYLQACSALEHGKVLAPEEHFYLFQTYALTELIENALGKLPLRACFPSGLKRLVEHDAGSAVSYLETLKIYLEQNMSVTRTASRLFLNRSTLLERMNRIKNLLDSDLQDAEERLLLQILLKAMEVQKKLELSAEQK